MQEISKEKLFNSMPLLLDRLCPFIITEINNPNNLSMFQKVMSGLKPYVTLDHIGTPENLFDFIQEHKDELIVISDDIFSKRKNYLNIVQGAVCSSPDNSSLWKVEYLNEKGFVFKGKIILCTNKTKHEIKSNKKLEKFARDCQFI